MSAALVAAALGIAQGARHALEPDHLAAVSTLAQDRPGAKSGLVLGASWGLGHTVSLLVVGGTLAALEARLPVRFAALFELLVAAMLVALGGRAVARALREGREGRPHAHRHAGVAHVHAAPEAHLHAGRWTLATRPLLVGLVHGLAGSGAISALVMAELPDAGSRLAFIGLFGLGSVVAMALMSAVVGTPLHRLERAPAWAGRLTLLVGLVSMGLGVWWGWAALALA
jgi:hypothetical protein